MSGLAQEKGRDMAMRGNAAWLGVAVMTAVIGIFVVGCATAPSGSTGASQADLLQQAGFRLYTAKSSQHLAYIHTLPAKKVVVNKYQKKPLYLVCPTAGSSQCYLGDRAAYDRYEQLALQQSIDEEQRKITEDNYAPEGWEMWVDSQGGG
jgi:hypothetical protein